MRRTLPVLLVTSLIGAVFSSYAESYSPFCVSGFLKDAFHDPTDSRHLFFFVESTNGAHHATLNKNVSPFADAVENAIGAEVCIRGQLVGRNDLPSRPYSVRETRPHDLTNGFAVVRAAPTDILDFPDAQALSQTTPDLLASGRTHRVRGRVLAAWNGHSLLLRTEKNTVVEAELRQRELPRCGETIDLAGLPETTLYRLRLNRAVWQSVAPPDDPGEDARRVSAKSIVMSEDNQPQMDTWLHGAVLRLSGIVRSLPNAAAGNNILYLEDDGFIVPVNTEAATPALSDV